MKLLVTGGAGFIGSNLVNYLLKNSDYEIVCVDNFNDFYNPEFKERNASAFKDDKRVSVYRTDIEDYEALKEVFDKEKPDKIVHLAALAGVRTSIKDPFSYEKVNVIGTLNLLELSRLFGIWNFVFASTSSVYGYQEKGPFAEDMTLGKPLSPYAFTKQSAESMAYTYHYLHGLNFTLFRFFTVYGPNGRPDMAPYKFTKLINEGLTLEQYGDGTSMRDYTYVEDMMPPIHAAIEKDMPFEIINLGNDKPIVLKDFIGIIEKILGKKAIVKVVPMPSADPPITHADISKAKRLLDYNPSTTIEKGMDKFIKWFLNLEKAKTI